MSLIRIIDGNSLLFRSFYAMYHPGQDPASIMRSKSGVPTNAIFIFHKFVKKIKSDLAAEDRLVVCFDTGAKTFRSRQLEAYKQQRKPIEEELAVQLPIAREMLDAMDIYHCELDGYEADDLAGSLTVYSRRRGDKVELYTSDKDYLQLLDDGVEVHFLRKGLSEIEIYTKDNLKEKFGVEPNQICDYKGLVGDTSDNFKGIPGIGDKTAIRLLNQYGLLEDIIAAMAEVNTKTAANILAHQEEGRFCKELASMVLDLDVEEFYKQGLCHSYSFDKLHAFYQKYDFTSFLRELNNASNLQFALAAEADRTQALTEENLTVGFFAPDLGPLLEVASFAAILNRPTVVLADFEKANYHRQPLKGFYLANQHNLFYLSAERAATDADFKTFLEDSQNEIDSYDCKALAVCCRRLGIDLACRIDFDLMLATYLIDTNVDSDPEAVLRSYRYPLKEDLPLRQNLAAAILNLKQSVLARLEKLDEIKLYREIELPLALVLARMEIEGVPLSLPTLQEYSIACHRRIDSLVERINSYAPGPLNLNSPRQVANFLYATLAIHKIDKKGSTSIEVLQKLRSAHPVIDLLIAYRKYSKIISAYTDALPANIFPDGRLHAVFNQALTTTGRLSMMEPNLQNISIRSEEGKEIRRAFFYPEGEYLLLSLDYSQIELRLLAHLSRDPALLEVFQRSEDIHRSTAAKIFGLAPEQVTERERRIAKTVNFSIVYGTSAYGLAEKLEIGVGEAKSIIEAFYSVFGGIRRYEEQIIEFAQTHGYVTTMLKRRRYLPDLNSPSHQLREFSKRAAVNATIQGSAADLIKAAMIAVDRELRGYQTRMILQIHDELIFKVPPSELGAVEPRIKAAMENAMQLDCPLVVEGSAARSWYEAK